VQYGDITGTLRDMNGAPIAGATVELHSDPVSTTTDENGCFEFTHVPLTEHKLLVKLGDDNVSEIPLSFKKSDTFKTSESERGVDIFVTSNTATIDITLIVEPGQPVQVKGISERREQDMTLYWCLLVILAVIVAVLITILIFRRKKDKDEDKDKNIAKKVNII
jgi:hypothetical protein